MAKRSIQSNVQRYFMVSVSVDVNITELDESKTQIIRSYIETRKGVLMLSTDDGKFISYPAICRHATDQLVSKDVQPLQALIYELLEFNESDFNDFLVIKKQISKN